MYCVVVPYANWVAVAELLDAGGNLVDLPVRVLLLCDSP